MIFYRIVRSFYIKKRLLLPKLIQFLIFLLYNSKVPADGDIGEVCFHICKGIGFVIIDNAVLGK